jgi:hypothetical protein
MSLHCRSRWVSTGHCPSTPARLSAQLCYSSVAALFNDELCPCCRLRLLPSLQLCCSSVAALLQRRAVPVLQAPAATFVPALLQLCCSSVAATSCARAAGSGCYLRCSSFAALLQLCCSDELCPCSRLRARFGVSKVRERRWPSVRAPER